MADYQPNPEKALSFPPETYERASLIHSQTITHQAHAEAVTPPLSWSRVCLPNKDGEYRPYKEVSEVETYVHSTSTRYYLGATACPRLLKCNACPLK